jgi:hypothetical protein
MLGNSDEQDKLADKRKKRKNGKTKIKIASVVNAGWSGLDCL